MKRFYFLMWDGKVFALEPHTQTLITTALNGAGQPRLVKATLSTLGIPAGRKRCQRAAIWQYTPLRLLIEYELNKKRDKTLPYLTVFPYTTRPTKPLVAFLAQERWGEKEDREWKEQQKTKNTKKKQHQRAVQKAGRKKKLIEGWTNIGLDEETE